MMRHLLRRIRNTVGNERGTALIAALMITLVLTILGLALFDLASLDARLALGNESDYRAMELAQSAIERALHQLLLDLCGGNAACTSPPALPSWADGIINGTAFPVSTGSFADFINSPGSPATGFADAVGFGGTGANVAYTSTYYVQLKNLTQTEANGLGVVCDAVDAASPCRDVIYVRATANFTAGIVQSSTRTVQVIAGATFNGLGEGLIAGAPASGAILGSASIHGSVHIVPCGTNPCTPFTESGNSGIFNNYNDGAHSLAPDLQAHVPLLPTITCPVGTACAGNTVETLNASVRIAKPDTGTVTIGGSGSIGVAGAGTTNGVTGKLGKPTVESVFLGTGCTPTCTNVVDNPNKVYSDKPIRGYDRNPPPTFPMLDDAVTLFNRNYNSYAACTGPGACNPSGGSPGDFFISHAFKIDATTVEDATGCLTLPTVPCTRNLGTIMAGTGSGLNAPWTDNTNTWRKTFSCVTTTCNDADGKRLNGSVVTVATGVQTFPLEFQLEWRGADWPNPAEQNMFVVYQCAIACVTPPLPSITPYTNPYVAPNPVLTPPVLPSGRVDDTKVVFPAMIYVDSDLRICENCNNKTFYYLGNAAFLAKGTVDDTVTSNKPSIAIDSGLRGCAPPCLAVAVDHDSFPKKHLLTFYTPGNIMMGLQSQRDMMGSFYAGGKWKTTKQTQLVGGVTARVFDLTGQVPDFWQVTMPRIATAFPPRAQRWNVTPVRWKECVGTLGSGAC